MNAISLAVEAAGGPIAAAKACGVRRQAVDKWVAKGALPRTEYTGETRHAICLAAAAAERGEPFDPAWLLAEAAPTKDVSAGATPPQLDRRAQLAPDDHRGRRITDPTGNEIKALRECGEKAVELAGRLAG